MFLGKSAAKGAAELVKPGKPHSEIESAETERCLDRFDKIRNSKGKTKTSELKVVYAKNNAK